MLCFSQGGGSATNRFMFVRITMKFPQVNGSSLTAYRTVGLRLYSDDSCLRIHRSVVLHLARSISATNNLAYLLARDALQTLALAVRQALQGGGGSEGLSGGLKLEDSSRDLMQAGDFSSESSSQVKKKTRQR